MYEKAIIKLLRKFQVTVKVRNINYCQLKFFEESELSYNELDVIPDLRL